MSTDNNAYILLKETTPTPKLAIAAIVILLAGVISMIVYMRSKPGSSQEVTSGQELIIGVDRATLYVPKDAATLVGVISISSLESNLYAVAGEESKWFRPQVVSIKYLDGKGIPYLHVTFPKPALICFAITERWQDYTQHPDEYLVQYYAEEQKPPGWVTLPMTANPDRQQLCGRTGHLSIFALALRPQAEIPITGADLTSTPVGFFDSTPTPTGTLHQASPTTSSQHGAVATPVSTQAALTATSIALNATDVPSTAIVPPTSFPTAVPTGIPTFAPTAVPTDVPTVAATNVPPTDPPATNPPPTDPPPPPPTDPPPTDPPPTDPPATNPPVATDPPTVAP